MTELRVTAQEMTCAGAPVQIEGTLSDGSRFYFRSRHRSISMGIGATRDDAVAGVGGEIVLRMVGYDPDRHPLSSLHEAEAYALTAMLARLHGECRDYVARKGGAP